MRLPRRSISHGLILASLTLGSACGGKTDDRTPQQHHDPSPPRLVTATPRIVDGSIVAVGAMLPIVALTRHGTRNLVCTGTLIAPDMVLTAGHCACPPTEVTGDAFVGDNLRKAGHFYYVKQKLKALSACSQSRKSGLDLTVGRLVNPVTDVVPVKFADDSLIARATEYRVVGFGAIDRNSQLLTYEKREAPVPAVSNDCTGTVANGTLVSQFFACQPHEEIVAGRRKTPDTCGGDSGGPLLVAADGTAGDPSSPALMLAGVTSRAVGNASPPCGSGGVYERMTPQARKWIDNTIKALRR